MEPTPEQRAAFYALANIINFGIFAAVVWTLFCDWIEVKVIEPWKKRIHNETQS